jgi:predicted O-methyltransferase YrrM
MNSKINLIIAPALETLNNLVNKKKLFDLIFIDADKENYIKYYELAFRLITNKGLILIDNVLWKGDVIDDNKKDGMIKIIKEFNSHIKNDQRIEKVILPIGDGVTVCRKI